MHIYRLIFRKTTGEMLLEINYGQLDMLPTIEQEIEDFAILNGYNPEALTIIDIPETDNRYEEIINAENIRLENGEITYTIKPKPIEPELPPDPVIEKLDLLIQMQLEREGII